MIKSYTTIVKNFIGEVFYFDNILAWNNSVKAYIMY